MKNITFKQFMLTYNFCYYNEKGTTDKEKEDTMIIRINYPQDEEELYYTWFEFGICDYAINSFKLKQINKIFSDYILNLYVEEIRYNEEINNVVNIYLTKDRYISEVLEEE